MLALTIFFSAGLAVFASASSDGQKAESKVDFLREAAEEQVFTIRLESGSSDPTSDENDAGDFKKIDNSKFLKFSAKVYSQYVTFLARFSAALLPYSQRLDARFYKITRIDKSNRTAHLELYAMEPDEISAAADLIVENTEFFLEKLDDGRKTYYMRIDLREKYAEKLSNAFVLRETAKKLLEKVNEKYHDDSFDLMDYTQIVGEIGIHLIGYYLFKSIGGENLKGKLYDIYFKLMIADLNVDEKRNANWIHIIGILLG